MFMYAVKKPAVAAAAALGEDGTAVFCEGPGLLFASARGEAPDAGITTAIFNVGKGDIHDGDRWFPGAGSIAEVVFDMPAPLGEKLAGRLEDSTFLIGIFRDEIASLSEECDVITGANIHVGPPAQLEMPAPHTASAPAARRLSEPTAAFRSCAAASTSSTTTGCPISAWRSMPPNTFTCRTGSSLPERKEHSPCLPRWTASSPETRRAPPRSS